MSVIARREWLAVAAGLTLACGGAGVAAAQTPADSRRRLAPAGAPEPLWVPDPEDADVERGRRRRRRGGRRRSARRGGDRRRRGRVTSPLGDVAGDDVRVAIAHWMARGMQDAGLPGELAGDGRARRVGAAQPALRRRRQRRLLPDAPGDLGPRRVRGLPRPARAAAALVRRSRDRRARGARAPAGDADYGADPATLGRVDRRVERPAARYRGRYQPRLAEAQALLATAAPPVAPFEVGLAVGAPVTPVVGAPDAAAQRVLSDPNITLSPVAIEDLQAGRIDPRLSSVLAGAAQVAPIADLGLPDRPLATSPCTAPSPTTPSAAASTSARSAARRSTPSNATARTLALALSRLPDEIRPTEIGTPWAIDDAGVLHRRRPPGPPARRLRRPLAAPAPSPRSRRRRRRGRCAARRCRGAGAASRPRAGGAALRRRRRRADVSLAGAALQGRGGQPVKRLAAAATATLLPSPSRCPPRRPRRR